MTDRPLCVYKIKYFLFQPVACLVCLFVFFPRFWGGFCLVGWLVVVVAVAVVCLLVLFLFVWCGFYVVDLNCFC